jgi:hypothetical protein
MNPKILSATITTILAATLAACGGGGSPGTTIVTPPASVSVPIMLSDASSEDWSTIGVKVLSISLAPQGGGSPVTVYTAPATVPVSNLAQLDSISELINTASVPAGTYTGATVTLSANAGDVTLIVSADPQAGFPVAAGTAIDPALIRIQGTQGTSGNLSVPVEVKFEKPITVAAEQTTPVDVEFDLGHPAFIIGHTVAAGTVWAVNFNKGPARHHRIDDIRALVLRHLYGTVSSVATSNASITIARDVPSIPVQNPETAVATGTNTTILADATNGTLYYDVDAKTSATIHDFSAQAATLTGKYVRVAARYQQDGTLVATRIWAASSFQSVWLSPEGHVLRVDPVADTLTVENESGRPVSLTVDANTKFYFRTPASATSDATPIGTGTAFLASPNIVRGFKVHASVVDPLASPLVAQTVDIESAVFDGRISAASANGFTHTRRFRTAGDDYTVTLPYIATTTPNGKDGNGAAITGFKFWDFGLPTLVTSGSSAVNDFVSAAGGGVSFGGAFGAVNAWGASRAVWGDTGNPSGWSARWTVLVPTPLPLGTVATAYAANSFALGVPGGANAVTVQVSTTTGSATLAYQVDRTNGVVTISPEDLTSSAGQSALAAGLAVGAPVKVYAVPQADGTLRAYVLVYYTGTLPTG